MLNQRKPRTFQGRIQEKGEGGAESIEREARLRPLPVK